MNSTRSTLRSCLRSSLLGSLLVVHASCKNDHDAVKQGSANIKVVSFKQEYTMKDGLGAPWEHPTGLKQNSKEVCENRVWKPCLQKQGGKFSPQWNKLVSARFNYLMSVYNGEAKNEKGSKFAIYLNEVKEYRRALLASDCAKQLDMCRTLNSEAAVSASDPTPVPSVEEIATPLPQATVLETVEPTVTVTPGPTVETTVTVTPVPTIETANESILEPTVEGNLDSSATDN